MVILKANERVLARWKVYFPYICLAGSTIGSTNKEAFKPKYVGRRGFENHTKKKPYIDSHERWGSFYLYTHICKIMNSAFAYDVETFSLNVPNSIVVYYDCEFGLGLSNRSGDCGCVLGVNIASIRPSVIDFRTAVRHISDIFICLCVQSYTMYYQSDRQYKLKCNIIYLIPFELRTWDIRYIPAWLYWGLLDVRHLR